jgi:hypothetical protein
MAVKRNNYILAELDFAETQLENWKEYIEINPIDKIEDRWGRKEMPKGGYAHVVTATAEQQIKCVQDTLTRYLQLLEVVNRLRKQEEQDKIEVRGGQSLGSKASKFLERKKNVTGN